MAQKLSFPVMAIGAWPACDRLACQNAMRPGDIFGAPGALTAYSDERVGALQAAYGRWLSYLQTRHGVPGQQSGLDHLSREWLAGFIDELSRALAPCTVRAYLTDLLTVARALAPERASPALHGAVRTSGALPDRSRTSGRGLCRRRISMPSGSSS